MSESLTIRVAQRGVVTLPKSLREAYNLKPGDLLSLIDLGGVFILSLRHSEIDSLADRITQAFIAKGETLETMLQALREERDHDATTD